MGITVFVNGYGAPKNPVTDVNLKTYLGRILKHILDFPDDHFTVYLCGGYTNRTDLSEASAMSQWFQAQELPDNVEFVLIQRTTTARDNLQALYDQVGDVYVHIYCEASRWRTMRFFAHHLFNGFSIHGIPFDTQSMHIWHRLKQLLFHYPIEVGAYHFPWIDTYIRKFLRALHVLRARKKFFSDS